MDKDELFSKLERLTFEDFIWMIFIVISAMNIFGNENEKQYLITNNKQYQNIADKVFLTTILISFFIYLYFFSRNYKAYKNADINYKELYLIKVLGSTFIISGSICLLYFQIKQTSFVGSPGI